MTSMASNLLLTITLGCLYQEIFTLDLVVPNVQPGLLDLTTNQLVVSEDVEITELNPFMPEVLETLMPAIVEQREKHGRNPILKPLVKVTTESSEAGASSNNEQISRKNKKFPQRVIYKIPTRPPRLLHEERSVGRVAQKHRNRKQRRRSKGKRKHHKTVHSHRKQKTDTFDNRINRKPRYGERAFRKKMGSRIDVMQSKKHRNNAIKVSNQRHLSEKNPFTKDKKHRKKPFKTSVPKYGENLRDL